LCYCKYNDHFLLNHAILFHLSHNPFSSSSPSFSRTTRLFKSLKKIINVFCCNPCFTNCIINLLSITIQYEQQVSNVVVTPPKLNVKLKHLRIQSIERQSERLSDGTNNDRNTEQKNSVFEAGFEI
jgi:hypothetical protein